MTLVEKYKECINPLLNKTTQTNVVLKESNRRYCLINTDNSWQVTSVKVENCISKDIGEKGCEAILIAERQIEITKGYFIELKGCLVGDAMKQIENSLVRTIDYLNVYILFGRIIPSEYKRTKFLESFEQRLILKFKKLGGNFIIRENFEEQL